MAITRTSMVDDDGSLTTGTIFNNAWKTSLYNEIDAALAAVIPPFTLGASYASDVPSGAINNWNLASLGNFTIFSVGTPSGATTITGIVAQPVGTVYLIQNRGPNTLTLATLNAGSTGPNQIVGPGFVNVVINPWDSRLVVYSVTGGPWSVMG